MNICFTDVSVRYGDRLALAPLTLTLTERRIGVVGLNGSGKTTFARLINGLVKPTAGTVTLDGLDTVRNESAVLGKAGFVFQNPQHQIIMPIVREDIAFGLSHRGLKKPEIEARTDAVLQRFGIGHLAKRRVHELSGGETQLVALASVVVTGPEVILFDEPTNQLDLRNRARVETAIAALPEQVLVISHDLPLIETFERVLLFHEAHLLADGAAADVIDAYRAVARC